MQKGFTDSIRNNAELLTSLQKVEKKDTQNFNNQEEI